MALCALRCREPVACCLLRQLTLARMKLGIQKAWIEHGVCSSPFGDGASEPREGAEDPAAAAIANGERPAPGSRRTIPWVTFQGRFQLARHDPLGGSPGSR